MTDEVKENNKQLVCEIKIDAEMMRKIIDEKMTQIELDIQGIRAKAIDEFYDKVLNFEDYIEPVDTSEFGAVLLYSGKDITNMIVKIKEQLKAGGIDG